VQQDPLPPAGFTPHETLQQIDPNAEKISQGRLVIQRGEQLLLWALNTYGAKKVDPISRTYGRDLNFAIEQFMSNRTIYPPLGGGVYRIVPQLDDKYRLINGSAGPIVPEQIEAITYSSLPEPENVTLVRPDNSTQEVPYAQVLADLNGMTFPWMDQ